MSHGNVVHPTDHLFLRLPNGSLKAVECASNQIIELGRLGDIHITSLIGRPYYHTFEIQEKAAGQRFPALKLVSPDELNAEIDTSEANAEDGPITTSKNNRLTVDDVNRQTLSHEEIEAMKKTSDGKAIIEKIMASHSAIDEKTEFSKAKYALRKTKKYLKRFTLLPMEFGYLIEYVLEKEPSRIMDLREESLGLLGSWSNAHWHKTSPVAVGHGRDLVVDDVGGLVVAALAERKSILRADTSKLASNGGTVGDEVVHTDYPSPATSNTITVVHSAIQPNVSLLKYFGYDTNQPDPNHLLHTHLKCLSWLQLLHPEEDPIYREPESAVENEIQSWKSGRRGAYFKKRRRWARVSAVIDDTRRGLFDSLTIATHMDLVAIMCHLVPLLRGGAQVTIYSPTAEPLVKLMDYYSKERRTAYINHLLRHGEPPSDLDDFPLDPRLLLAPTMQTSRIREYQVLPSRTHPLMTSRGGPEGFIFTATRVLPIIGGIEARGTISKKRKAEAVDT